MKFVTEAIFDDSKGRADILVLDNGVVYEVLHTESLDQAKKKINIYPPILEIRFIKTTDKVGIKTLF